MKAPHNYLTGRIGTGEAIAQWKKRKKEPSHIASGQNFQVFFFLPCFLCVLLLFFFLCVGGGPFDTHEEDGYSVEETGWSVPMYASLNESVSALLSPAQQRDMQVVQQALEEDSTCLDSPPPAVEVPGEKDGEGK